MIIKNKEKLLVLNTRQIKKCCGITIADFDIESFEINSICCTKCSKSIAFMECESNDIVTEWNSNLE